MLAAAGCWSAGSPEAGGSPGAPNSRETRDLTAPMGTMMFSDFTITWNPSGEPGDEIDLILEELRRVDAYALMPTAPPEGPEAQESSGELRIRRSGPSPDVHVDVIVRAPGDDVALSATGTSAVHPSCEDRLDGVGGEDGWYLVEVRSAGGCTSTNDVGLSFIEWDESGLWWHAESRMEPGAAITWLEEWTVLG